MLTILKQIFLKTTVCRYSDRKVDRKDIRDIRGTEKR